MDYYALHLTVDPVMPGSEILMSVLAEIGYESFELSDIGLDAYIPEDEYDERAIESVIQFEYFKVSYTKELIKHTNWNLAWESEYDEVLVSDNCVIRAPFHKKSSSIEYDIIIQPQMSFGTGHHPTTLLMMQELLTLEVKDKSILDMGSGTGVLSVLAEKKGAKDVLAIEIDHHAALNCKENVALNRCVHISVEKGDSGLINGREFDVIFANINLNVLLKDLELYIDALKDKGTILLSGFYLADSEQLIVPLERLGLVQNSIKSIDHWTILNFQKTPV